MLCGIAAAASFGLIPLFTIPVIREGMSVPVILFYRFVFTVIMLFLLPGSFRIDWRIGLGQYLETLVLSVLYCICAVSLFTSYRYINSGLATALTFLYPVFTAVIMCVFYKEKMTLKVGVSVFLAVTGAVLISVNPEKGLGFMDPRGLFLALVSAASYGIYLVLIRQFSVNSMPNAKLNVYIFFNGILCYGVYMLFSGGFGPVTSFSALACILLLAFVTTVIANLTLVYAIKTIGSTMSSILGAFEPLTALLVGALVFGEKCGKTAAVGICMVILSVSIIFFSETVNKFFRRGKYIYITRVRHIHPALGPR